MRLRQMAVRIECQDQDYRKLRGPNEQKRRRYLKIGKIAKILIGFCVRYERIRIYFSREIMEIKIGIFILICERKKYGSFPAGACFVC